MDRLKLIEVIAATLKLRFEEEIRVTGMPVTIPDYGQTLDDVIGPIAGRVADAIIVSGALRSLRTGEVETDDPEGGTMPRGPWTGHP